MIIVIVAIVALAIGAAIAFVINNTLLKSRAEDIVKKAEDEAKVIFEKKNLEAREKYNKYKSEFETQLIGQFGIHSVQTYLVKLVNCNGYIHNLIGLTDGFGYSGQYLAVVQLDCHTDTELAEHHIYHLDKLYLIEQ